MVVLSVDVWHRFWREQVIDDFALTRITVITETSDLSILLKNLRFYSFFFQPITSFLTLKLFHSLIKAASNLLKILKL